MDSKISPLVKRVGIVVVHGVIPHPRFQIQDEFAANLRAALNADPKWSTYGQWVASIVNPRDGDVGDTLRPHPTRGRVRVSGDDPDDPQQPYFDIIEGYWSPLDKGIATFAGIVTWLLQTVFVPLNTTARFMARAWKTTYDVTFVTVGIVAVVGLLLGALIAAIGALNELIVHSGQCEREQCLSAWQILLSPGKIGTIFRPKVILILAMGAAGAFLIAQAAKAIFAMAGQSAILKNHGAQRAERWRLILIVAAIGSAMFAAAGLLPVDGGQPLAGSAWLFIIAALCFEVGRTVAKSFIVNFFADVLIYTTRDENSTYFAIRDRILDLVTQAIVHACSDKANNGVGYDRVFVLGHSLGSTICLDALTRFSNLCEQDPRLDTSFDRLRGFVTFGSPLEKTKYFFDVMNASPSAAMLQYRSDAYGALFTADARELDAPAGAARGIVWTNYWYFFDAIANELISYRSFVGTGAPLSHGHHLRDIVRRSFAYLPVPTGHVIVGRDVVRNELGHQTLSLPGVLPHGKYLGDHPWFWATDAAHEHLGVLDIVARWGTAASTRGAEAEWDRIVTHDSTPFATRTPTYVSGFNATYETIPAKDARKFADHYPPPPHAATSPDENDSTPAPVGSHA